MFPRRQNTHAYPNRTVLVCERQAQYNIALIAQHLLLGKAVFLSSNAKRALNQKQIYILTTTLSLIFLFIQSKSFRSWLYKTERN